MITAIIAKNLACYRHNKPLFQACNFSLHSGQLLFIEGQNGVGKSTLLRAIAGLNDFEDGNLTWNILNTQDDPCEHMHFVSHQCGIKLGLTVEENLQLICALHNIGYNCFDACLKELKLDQQRYQLARTLSAGQKRRLGLAKLWLIKKSLWLLDEPLTALDNDMCQIFLNYLTKHLQQGGLAILTSHQHLELNIDIQSLKLLPC